MARRILWDLGSDLVGTYNSIKCLGMVQTPTKTDPWSIPLELFKRTILASAPQGVVWNRPGISTDQGRSFVPGDDCSQSGDQQEARKTCIPGRLIIKLATVRLAGSVEREQREAACGRPCQLIPGPVQAIPDTFKAGPGISVERRVRFYLH